jgi:hypothetical protein
LYFKETEGKEWVQNFSDEKWSRRDFTIEFDQIMVLAAVVSSIDLLAVTPQIPNATYTKMHNLILG